MAPTETFELGKIRSFSEKLGDTFNFIRLNAGLFLQVHLFISLPIVIVLAGIFYLIFPEYFSLLSTVDSGVFIDDVSRRQETLSWFIQNVFFPAVAVLPVSANTFILMDAYQKTNGKLTFSTLTKHISKYLPKLLLAKFFMLPIMLFLLLLALITEEIGLEIFLIVILSPLCLTFYNLFTCTELLILQHQYPLGRALSYSSKIMSRYFFPAYGSNIVIMIVFLFLTFAMEFPAMAIDTLEGVTVLDMDMDGFWSIFASALRAFSAIAGLLLFTVVSTNAGIQYFTLKEQNNRTSIMDRIRMIGQNEATENIYAEDEQY